MRVCYFGGYDQDHPRNRVLISGLKKCGIEVMECHSRHPIKAIRALILMFEYWRLRNCVDLMVVGASGHTYMPLAWILSRLMQRPLVFDAFVSVYEIYEEEDRSRPMKCYAFLLDWLSSRLADVVLFDTEQHASYFAELIKMPINKVKSVPVGADSEVFLPAQRNDSKNFKVLFTGSFLPLHGADVVVRAAKLLSEEREIVIELIGDGRQKALAQLSCQSANVSFKDPVPYSDYVRVLGQSDVALGVFGATPKAARVIPCKVYDALAAGVPLITSDTPAIRGILHHGENALLVPPGDARALAEAILLLRSSPLLREHLARKGRTTFHEVGRPEVIGTQLVGICAQVAQATGQA